MTNSEQINNAMGEEFNKINILRSKGFKDVSNTKGTFYLTPEDAKELNAVGPIDDSLFIPGVDFEANMKAFKAILSRKLTIDQAIQLVERDIQIEAFKKENGCEKVFVDSTYARIKIFPIYNKAQEDFIKAIFVDGTWSRFDRAILVTLESKYDTLEELFEIYSNEIDD